MVCYGGRGRFNVSIASNLMACGLGPCVCLFRNETTPGFDVDKAGVFWVGPWLI